MHLGTRSLTLTVDGIYRTAEVSNCQITSAPKQGIPERVWRDGVRHLSQEIRDYRLVAKVVQDPAQGSLWDLVWNRAGENVDVDLRPAGGSVPSDAQPWFLGTVTILVPDGIVLGGAANASLSNKFTFDIDWPFLEKPTLVRA